jgi:hypothetical protein
LASLALLITALACLMACADISRWKIQYAKLLAESVWWVVGLFGGAAALGAIVGGIYSFAGRHATWRTRLMAPFAGILAGEATVLVLVAPGAIWRTVLSVSILLVAAVLFRIDAD